MAGRHHQLGGACRPEREHGVVEQLEAGCPPPAAHVLRFSESRQHRLDALHVGGLATGQDQRLALLDGRHAAHDRRRHQVGEAFHQLVQDVGTGGGHLDEGLVRVRLQPRVDVAHRAGVGEDRQDHLGTGRCRRGALLDPSHTQAAGFLQRAIPEGQLMTGGGQAARNGRAHLAGTQEGDPHL